MEETKKQLEELEQYVEKLKQFIVSLEQYTCKLSKNSAKRLACVQRDIENAHTAIEMAYDEAKIVMHIDTEQAEIPCIECNEELFERLWPYLNIWGYNNANVTVSWDDYPLLVLNYGGNLGDVANIRSEYYTNNNREFVDDPEELLAKAAKLKGYEYKSNS